MASVTSLPLAGFATCESGDHGKISIWLPVHSCIIIAAAQSTLKTVVKQVSSLQAVTRKLHITEEGAVASARSRAFE